MTTQQNDLDRYAILTPEAMERIVTAVLARLEARDRATKLREREAVLMQLRVIEDDLGMDRSRPTKRERE